MNSKSVMVGLLVSLCSITISACVENLPVFPIQTDDSDWAPTVTLTQNGYRRIELRFTNPPRKELLRNLLSYEVQVRSTSSGDFTTIHWISGTRIDPAYVYYGGYTAEAFAYSLATTAVLSDLTSYTVRVRTVYALGPAKLSNEISFTTPKFVGKILRQLPIPKRLDYETGEPFATLAFYKGDLIVRRQEQIFKVDTSSGQATLITRDFRLPLDSDFMDHYQPLAVAGDTLLAFHRPDSRHTGIAAMTLDLVTLQINRFPMTSLPGQVEGCVVGPGSLLYALTYSDRGYKFLILDWREGRLLQTLPILPRKLDLNIYGPGVLAFNGSGFWYSSVNSFDNRIWRIDLSTLEILEEHRNPVFAPWGLAWDGSHFWTVDKETWMIVKLQLEGL